MMMMTMIETLLMGRLSFMATLLPAFVEALMLLASCDGQPMLWYKGMAMGL